MMSHSSTPFKVLENLGDENDSTVMKKSLRGSRAIDLPSKGISVFRDVTKPNSVSNVAKSSRKPLLDLSKGQLNSRLTGISIKSDSIEKGIARKPKSQLSSTHNIPKSISSKTSDAENQKGPAGFELEDMICSGGRVLEDPYDYVMRKSDAMKIKIVPSTSTGFGSTSVIDQLAEIKSFTDNISFGNTEEHDYGGGCAYLDDNTLPDFPDF